MKIVKKYGVLCVLLGLQTHFITAMLLSKEGMLTHAIEQNNQEEIQQALQKGANPTTGLYAAIEFNNLDLVILMINKNADIEANRNGSPKYHSSGYTPLEWAIFLRYNKFKTTQDKNTNFAIIQKLLERAEPNTTKYNPLIKSIENGDRKLYTFLIQHTDANFDLLDLNTNLTPLLTAAKRKNTHALKLLDDWGVNYEESLIQAVRNNDLLSLKIIANAIFINQEIFKNLPGTFTPGYFRNHPNLTQRPNQETKYLRFAEIIDRQNFDGTRPLTTALQKNNKPIISWLLKQGVSVSPRDLFLARDPEIVKVLIQHNPRLLDTRTQQFNNMPLLNYAIIVGLFNHARTLIEMDIDINAQDPQKRNALMIIAISKKPVPEQLIKLLLEHKDMNFYATDNNGNNIMHYAVANHKMNLIKKIIQHANLQQFNVPNKNGKTPTQLAREYGFVDIPRMLNPKGKGPEIEERPMKRQRIHR